MRSSYVLPAQGLLVGTLEGVNEPFGLVPIDRLTQSDRPAVAS